MTRAICLATVLVLAIGSTGLAQVRLTPEEAERLVRENEKLKTENKRLQERLQASGQASSATAVVDLQRVYEALREKLTIEAEFKTREENFKRENEQREKKLKELETVIRDMVPGTAEYADIEEQLAQAMGDYRVWLTIEAGKINRDRAEWIRNIYGKMVSTIGDAAKERGYDLVLFKAPAIDFSEVRADQVSRTIQTRKVLWAIQELDLTDLVIQKMNLAFERGQRGN